MNLSPIIVFTFGTNTPQETYKTLLITPSYGLNKIIMFFYKDSFGIK